MNDLNIPNRPSHHEELLEQCERIGFGMASDQQLGNLLKTLVTSKPGARLLELGTGIGLSLSWMRDGMDKEANITTIDNDPRLVAIAQKYFGHDTRVRVVCADATDWIRAYEGEAFDFVFADAWPGKYSELEALLQHLKKGGFYVVDDMAPQPNWPEGHQQHVDALITYLEQREDINLTKLNWSTGLVIAVKNQ